MKIKHQAILVEKEAQIQGITDLHKDDPKIDQFITKALSLSSQLMHQKELLCQKISQWNSYCETSDRLTSQVIEKRLKYDEILKRVSDFINWHNLEDGRKSNLPKLKESHKEILFAYQHSRLRQAEKATTNAKVAVNNVIKNINENLHSANLLEESILGFLPNVDKSNNSGGKQQRKKEK